MQPDRVCPMQRDHKVSASWCDKVQRDELCGKCKHNEGRAKSRYQEKLEEEVKGIF